MIQEKQTKTASDSSPDASGEAFRENNNSGDEVLEEKRDDTSKEAILPNVLQKSAVGVLGLLLLAVVVSAIFFDKEEKRTVVLENEANATTTPSAFADITLEARAAYVWDVKKERVLFSLNEEVQLPLASLTKLMTAVVATETLTDDTVLSVDNASLETEGDNGLLVNERWSVRDLLDLTLVASSNDGARVIAGAAGALTVVEPSTEGGSTGTFIDLMNRKAADLGLVQTYYLNETGLDSSEATSGGYGSARDVSVLFEYAIANIPELIDATRYEVLSFESLDHFEHEIENTNESIGKIPGLIGGKTGFTDLAGGNLTVAFDAGVGHPIIITVLGSTQEGRFRDVEKLVAASLESL